MVFILFSAMVYSQTTNISVLNEVDGTGYPAHFGVEYTIRGIVTTTNMDPGSLQFFMQDATGGIQVYDTGSAAWYANKGISVGTDLTVKGTVGFYNGTVEIVPALEADLTNNGTGALPTPQTITIADLQDGITNYALRGSLVKLLNVYRTTGSPVWPGTGVNANLIIAIGSNSGTPTGIMRIDKDFDCDENPEPTWPQDVTAVYTQYDTSANYDAGWQITPRGISDFQPYTSVSDWEMY